MNDSAHRPRLGSTNSWASASTAPPISPAPARPAGGATLPRCTTTMTTQTSDPGRGEAGSALDTGSQGPPDGLGQPGRAGAGRSPASSGRRRRAVGRGRAAAEATGTTTTGKTRVHSTGRGPAARATSDHRAAAAAYPRAQAAQREGEGTVEQVRGEGDGARPRRCSRTARTARPGPAEHGERRGRAAGRPSRSWPRGRGARRCRAATGWPRPPATSVQVDGALRGRHPHEQGRQHEHQGRGGGGARSGQQGALVRPRVGPARCRRRPAQQFHHSHVRPIVADGPSPGPQATPSAGEKCPNAPQPGPPGRVCCGVMALRNRQRRDGAGRGGRW